MVITKGQVTDITDYGCTQTSVLTVTGFSLKKKKKKILKNP